MQTSLRSVISFELYVNFITMKTISSMWLIGAVAAFFVLLLLFAYMVLKQPEEKNGK